MRKVAGEPEGVDPFGGEGLRGGRAGVMSFVFIDL